MRKLRPQVKQAIACAAIIGIAVTAVTLPASLHIKKRTDELAAQRQTTVETVRIVEVEVPAEVEPAAVEPTNNFDADDIELIARTIWGEAGGVKSVEERAAVAWCILNRVDSTGKTIEEVVTAPNQFHGYRTTGECPDEHMALAADVLGRWNAEKAGVTDSGRTLPAEYLYFWGDGERNHFTTKYKGTNYWDWSLVSPYK